MNEFSFLLYPSAFILFSTNEAPVSQSLYTSCQSKVQEHPRETYSRSLIASLADLHTLHAVDSRPTSIMKLTTLGTTSILAYTLVLVLITLLVFHANRVVALPLSLSQLERSLGQNSSHLTTSSKRATTRARKCKQHASIFSLIRKRKLSKGAIAGMAIGSFFGLMLASYCLGFVFDYPGY